MSVHWVEPEAELVVVVMMCLCIPSRESISLQNYLLQAGNCLYCPCPHAGSLAVLGAQPLPPFPHSFAQVVFSACPHIAAFLWQDGCPISVLIIDEMRGGLLTLSCGSVWVLSKGTCRTPAMLAPL